MHEPDCASCRTVSGDLDVRKPHLQAQVLCLLGCVHMHAHAQASTHAMCGVLLGEVCEVASWVGCCFTQLLCSSIALHTDRRVRARVHRC